MKKRIFKIPGLDILRTVKRDLVGKERLQPLSQTQIYFFSRSIRQVSSRGRALTLQLYHSKSFEIHVGWLLSGAQR